MSRSVAHDAEDPEVARLDLIGNLTAADGHGFELTTEQVLNRRRSATRVRE
ncbi:MAG: hypothetical protein U5K81_11635 [Trueperaceae bacterium]|nr:hypothetical protein [Trueperaceae bacterium]